MLVDVLLDTELGVHYGFLTLCSAQTEVDEDSIRDAWRAQTNGMVGAAVPEMLRIRTETHAGRVRVRIELHDAAPDLSDDWPEIVEVWFANWVDDLTLSAFEEFDGPVSLPPGSYQVRCAAGTIPVPVDEPDEPSTAESLLLQFWPATGTDRIVRQTGRSAEYRHRTGTEAPWNASELSARVAELRSNQELYEEDPPDDPDRADLPAGWPYHYLLRGLGRAGQAIGYLDPELAAHLTTADPATLRAIACWAVDQALTIAEIRDDLPGIDEALAAVRRGAGLPPTFPESGRIYAHLESEQPEAVKGLTRAFVKQRAVEQLYLAAEPPSMETTCSILDTTGCLVGGSPDWIVSAVRHVFPRLIPTNR